MSELETKITQAIQLAIKRQVQQVRGEAIEKAVSEYRSMLEQRMVRAGISIERFVESVSDKGRIEIHISIGGDGELVRIERGKADAP